VGALIKFIVSAVWICAVTVGAVFYSFQSANTASAPEAQAPLMGGLDYVKTEVISVPLLRESRIEGYFLTRLVYTVEPEMMAKLSVPAESLMVDEVYTYLYSNPQIDFSKAETMDLDAFRVAIRDRINLRAETKLVHEVLIEQIDFLSKDEIRDNTIRRKIGATDDSPEAEPSTPPVH
jgi:hypothetical protein